MVRERVTRRQAVEYYEQGIPVAILANPGDEYTSQSISGIPAERFRLPRENGKPTAEVYIERGRITSPKPEY